MNGVMLPKQRRPQLYRAEKQVLIGTTDTPILGPNPRRFALVFGTPVGGASGSGQFQQQASVQAEGVNTGVTGDIVGFTAPGTDTYEVWGAFYSTSGGTAPVVRVTYTPSGGSQYQVSSPLSNASFTPLNVILAPGDRLAVTCVVAGAGSTSNAQLSIMKYPASSGGGSADNTVFISLDGASSVNGGMPLHPGANNFQLLYDHIGQAMREEVRGIASSTPVTLTVWDIFEVDCPCQDY